jgi:hypothetical protein
VELTRVGSEVGRQRADGYVVGAYAASPTLAGWDERLEADFYETLASDPRIGALELPWAGALHPHDEDWLFAHLPARFDVVLTDVGHVYLTGLKRPHFGIAAVDEDERVAALSDVRRMRDDVMRLNDARGRRVTRAVELHAGPRGNLSSAASLARSLSDLADWNWDGAELVLEHCDALVPGHAPEKGFLRLADELEAVRRSRADVGIGINWGRSALELRDPERVVDHIESARDAGKLRALVFSGASAEAGYAAKPWSDVHNMFRRSPAHPHGDPVSLLTGERARAALQAAPPGVWLGVKLWWPPQRPGSVSDRATMIADALDELDSARGHRDPDNRLEHRSKTQHVPGIIQR